MRLETARKVQALAREIDALVDQAFEVEADHFRQLDEQYRESDPGWELDHSLRYTKESAELRRRSMDLTRALADLRQGR